MLLLFWFFRSNICHLSFCFSFFWATFLQNKKDGEKLFLCVDLNVQNPKTYYSNSSFRYHQSIGVSAFFLLAWCNPLSGVFFSASYQLWTPTMTYTMCMYTVEMAPQTIKIIKWSIWNISSHFDTRKKKRLYHNVHIILELATVLRIQSVQSISESEVVTLFVDMVRFFEIFGIFKVFTISQPMMPYGVMYTIHCTH